MNLLLTTNKRAVTLFEVLVVMTLLAVALGAAFIPLSKALRGERFERGVDQLIGKLALAQEIMLDFHTDVLITLDKQGDEVICKLKPCQKLPPHLEKTLNRYETIKGIDEIAFDNEERNSIVLHFDGTLGTTPEGKLVLTSNNKEEVLVLKGYPTQIKRGEHADKNSSEANYPEEIVSTI